MKPKEAVPALIADAVKPAPVNVIYPPSKFDEKVKVHGKFYVFADDRFPPERLIWARISDLIADAKNAKEHGERSIEALTQSFSRFGQQGSIVVQRKTRIVGAGNGSMLAVARNLGWQFIRVTLTDLEGAEFRAFCLAHNRSAEHNEWKWDVVSEQLAMIQEATGDIATLGWRDYEYAALLSADWTPSLGGLSSESDKGSDGEDSGEDDSTAVTVKLEGSFAKAVEYLRKQKGNKGMTTQEALELICADWCAREEI